MTRSRTLYYALLVLIVSACAFTRAQDSPSFTPTPTRMVVQTTLVPTRVRELHGVPSPEPAVSATPGVIQCDLPESEPTTRHTVVADMNYLERTFMVQQRVDYINRTRNPLTQIVMNVKPNSVQEMFDLQRLTLADETVLEYRLIGLRLMIDLPESLAVGCGLTLVIQFSLQMPEMDNSAVNAYQGYLGYSYRQANLGHWLPTIAPLIEDEWVSHTEIPIGEQEVLDDADWDVTLNVDGAPENLKVAAPGKIETDELGHWRFTLTGARDFSLSMGEGFNISSLKTEQGVVVELYSFDDAIIPTDSGPINSPAFALDVAAKSLNMYEDLFGDYPYERMVVIQGDFPDGMEFSGLVFVGGEYFRGFGGPNSYLMMITVHEIAHQWWYGRVGNDQAINPWLDEALATYSEYVFVEEYFPALKDWWWNFRVDSLAPEGFVDSTVYEFSSRRAYINAVYLRGVRMLNDLRNDLGTDVFFEWIRGYAEAGAGRIMTPEQFWGLLTPEQLETTQVTRERYLRQPQIIVIGGDGIP
ncbi:MAG: M1 family metallopeptidase [Anaerolineae bacterium]|nr:M1 family metallopeptidase [Anaerolineae bacterium]